MENVAQKNEKSIPGAIKIDEKEVFDHLDTLVRQSVPDTTDLSWILSNPQDLFLLQRQVHL